ncbi:MAG TPA: monovalent cation/H+ antiporter subunit A [Xanthomonadaceae bacterium]|nr:monovalent cation/H+ antiporter subunit A [Xanthomonadaceae bacterium]
MPSAILWLPFAASAIVFALHARRRNVAAWLMTCTALACLALTLALYPSVADGGVARSAFAWAPSLGLEFVLRVDGFAWLFMVLVTGIGALVGIYARYYMPPDDPLSRFYGLLLAFMGAMLGIVMSGNVIQLVFFWELTSLFSFLLIGYWHNGASARDAARMALIVTSGGGLCLLAGVLLLGHIVGSYDLDAILAAGDLVRGHRLYLPALVLVLLGALTKSAQFPFHFWLPQAMSAPTPVSAYLHSATMVKAGVFLLVRFWPALGGTPEWQWIVGGAGLVTLVLGAYQAIFQHDLKAVLAYSTLSHLGLITMLAGMGSALGVVAAIFHIVNHATFKASLFMAAGAVDHEAGTRDLRALGGLGRVMPITASLAFVATAAMAGVPLLNGFLSKEMFFAEALAAQRGPLSGMVPALAIAASAFGVVYSLRFARGVFLGPLPAALPRQPHEPPRWMRLPIGLLALACLLVGILPGQVIGPPLAAAAHSVLGGDTPAYSLAVWHGWTAPLQMSFVAFALGLALYAAIRHRVDRRERAPLIGRISGRRMFERALSLFAAELPARLAARLQARRLQSQLMLIVLAALLAGGLAATGAAFEAPALRRDGFDPAFALLWVLGATCAIGAAAQAKFHRLAALILTGGAGLVSCVSFVWLSAPDLAATQLLVEVVTTILILLGLRWLPKRIQGLSPDAPLSRLKRWRDALLALVVGAGVATLAYAAMLHPVQDSVSNFFLERSYLEGGGRNVVNVILVDFRGFDTLGEISVLGIVALTVFVLLRRFRPAAESIRNLRRQRRDSLQDAAGSDRVVDQSTAEYLAIPGLIVQLMFPVILLFGAHLFLRGHDLPGGGFAAGITVSVALILMYMARGARWVEAHLRVRPLRWMGAGLLLAAGTGLGALAFGHPFLTSHFRHATLPLIGEIPLASAVLFDLGVFCLVVGATTLMLVALAHQSLRRPRVATVVAADGSVRPEGAG